MAVWFTSDLHISHKLVVLSRGFDRFGGGLQDIEAHDATLADNWDRVVKPVDIVWVLGDISSGSDSAQTCALSWLMNRPGEKHLIPGNHDGCHPMHRDSHKYHQWYSTVFASIQPFARRKIGRRRVLLSHFPYQGDSGPEDRHTQYRLPDQGLPIVHGHIHRPWRATTSTPIYVPDYRLGDGASVPPNQFHVGVDAWDMAPVHIDQLHQLMEEVGA